MRTLLFLASTFLVLGACSPKSLPDGSEKGPCYGNKTCDEGLSCYSELCVKAPAVSPQPSNEAELTELRTKLEAAEMTVARLKTLRESEVAAQPRTIVRDRSRESIKDPFSKSPSKADDGDTMLNPFTKSNERKRTRVDPCDANPNSPECMLD